MCLDNCMEREVSNIYINEQVNLLSYSNHASYVKGDTITTSYCICVQVRGIVRAHLNYSSLVAGLLLEHVDLWEHGHRLKVHG